MIPAPMSLEAWLELMASRGELGRPQPFQSHILEALLDPRVERVVIHWPRVARHRWGKA